MVKVKIGDVEIECSAEEALTFLPRPKSKVVNDSSDSPYHSREDYTKVELSGELILNHESRRRVSVAQYAGDLAKKYPGIGHRDMHAKIIKAFPDRCRSSISSTLCNMRNKSGHWSYRDPVFDYRDGCYYPV